MESGSTCNVKELQASLFHPCRTTGTYISSFLQNTLKTNQVEVNTDNRTLKPIARLKEPRDLFALPKELDCSQQAARWPTECQKDVGGYGIGVEARKIGQRLRTNRGRCTLYNSHPQVLEERVQHIEYTPPAPELYYQPTGKEIQPKPIGEEAGTVVFQYYPISAVNYFSRSCVGGSRYFVPGCITDKENDDDLKFESRFESGNLAKVVKITETYYELYLRTDLYTNRHMQWFYFRIQNTKKHIIYRFSLVNLSKGDSLYSVGMKPLLYSTKDAQLNAIGWRRCGDNIAYYKNDPTSEDEDEVSNYTLTFNIEFPHDQDEVYLAHCYPYTYSDLQDYLNKLQNHPIKSNFTKLRLLCRSLAGNNVYYLTITEPPVGEESKKKKAVVVTARVHPGETPSSWMMKGFMDFLTGESDQAKELREKFIFKLVPMLNPDGVIVGNNRCSLTGRDLNRQYRTVIRETYPPVWHTKLMIRRLMEECGIAMYCDLHAHSRKHNVFIYGCENKRYVEKRLQEQVFPLMLHKNAADKFSFENCKFRIQRSKEGTGRVVVWMMGVANSYTMEASFAGSTMGSRVDTHFNVQDFESIGKAFCETLLDFCDEDPSKEKLRIKIIERLVKEGSSADEPTNIILSDYSSDEGDTSSSSAECANQKERKPMWEARECPTTSFVSSRPPSCISPKKESRVKHKARGHSARAYKKTFITDKTPPMPRKPLQVHKTTLDAPCIEQSNDGLDFTTEADSGDESSWPKGSRRFRYDGKGKKIKRKRMPPELIVTPVQVYENGETPQKETKKGFKKNSPNLKRKNVNPDIVGDKFRLWHHAKCLQAQNKSGKSISELATEVQLKLGTTLRQKVWTGCPCTAIHNDTPLSKSSSLGFTHWSKGPLVWSNFPSQQANENLLGRPPSQRLNTQTSRYEDPAQKKKKSHSKNSKSSKQDGDAENPCLGTKPKRKSVKNSTEKPQSTTNDPTIQVALLKISDTKSPNYKGKVNAPDKSPSKARYVSSNPNPGTSSKGANAKLRKSGFVVAAISRHRSNSTYSESEGEPIEKSFVKKKKKRKCTGLKKSKRAQSAKEMGDMSNKSKNVDK